jgi:hypothetical protein
MPALGTTEAYAGGLIVRQASVAGGSGACYAADGERDGYPLGVEPARNRKPSIRERGARGQRPLASRQRCANRRKRDGRVRPSDNATDRKGNKASGLVAIRDLFCKRCRAMLQYGTPDWARPRLARLPITGAFVFVGLILKRRGAENLQMLASPGAVHDCQPGFATHRKEHKRRS